MSTRVPEALRRFIWDIQSMVELADSPREILLIGQDLMRRLVAADDWLPSPFATAGAEPQLFELFHDGMERFCVVACVLAPGQGGPCLRDGVWELTGVLRGEVTRTGAGAASRTLATGSVETSLGGEAREIVNARADAPAVLIQVYGGDIGRIPRTLVQADGSTSEIVTGYANPADAPAYDILSIQAEIVD